MCSGYCLHVPPVQMCHTCLRKTTSSCTKVVNQIAPTKRVVARPNQPKVSPRPKVQVTSIAPTNSNRHPISSSQHDSLNGPDQKCCQSNRPDQALESAVNQTAPTKSAHPLSQIATTKARLIPQRAFCYAN